MRLALVSALVLAALPLPAAADTSSQWEFSLHAVVARCTAQAGHVDGECTGGLGVVRLGGHSITESAVTLRWRQNGRVLLVHSSNLQLVGSYDLPALDVLRSMDGTVRSLRVRGGTHGEPGSVEGPLAMTLRSQHDVHGRFRATIDLHGFVRVG
jgi:hypothetical protein